MTRIIIEGVEDPVYDDWVRGARFRLAEVEADRLSTGEANTPWVRYKRQTHYARIVSAQDDGIHKICLLDKDAQICTCSLRLLVGAREPFVATGHLDTRSWQPVDHFVTEREPHTEVSKRRYAVVCQLCSSVTAASDLQGAQFGVASHRHVR